MYKCKKKTKMEFGQKQELDTFDNKYQTGSTCPKSGTWVCRDHPAVEERLRKGDIFPSCYHVAGHRAIWWYVVGS